MAVAKVQQGENYVVGSHVIIDLQVALEPGWRHWFGGCCFRAFPVMLWLVAPALANHRATFVCESLCNRCPSSLISFAGCLRIPSRAATAQKLFQVTLEWDSFKQYFQAILSSWCSQRNALKDVSLLLGLLKTWDFRSTTNNHWRFYSEQTGCLRHRNWYAHITIPWDRSTGQWQPRINQKSGVLCFQMIAQNSVNAHHCPGRCSEKRQQA